jgi:hypothetical protein
MLGSQTKSAEVAATSDAVIRTELASAADEPTMPTV